MAKKADRTEKKNANFERVYSPIKTHGGKFYQVDHQLAHAPPRDSYDHFIDACAGGGTVLLAHDPTDKAEILNDLDGVLTNFWYVLQSEEMFGALQRRLQCTPFSQVEFNKAKTVLKLNNASIQPVELAAALFVLVRQSRQAMCKSFGTVTKNRTRRGMNEQVSAWLSAVDGLDIVHDRLRRVRIENQPVATLLKTWRTVKRAFIYIDPPYHPDVRTSKEAYRVEMTAEQHVELLEELKRAHYKFMLCGYAHPLYLEYAIANKWRPVSYDIDNKASSAKEKELKTEFIWMNY